MEAPVASFRCAANHDAARARQTRGGDHKQIEALRRCGRSNMRMSRLHCAFWRIFLEANPLYDWYVQAMRFMRQSVPGQPNPMKRWCGLKHKSFRCVFSNRVNASRGSKLGGAWTTAHLHDQRRLGDGIPRRLTKTKNGAGGFVISQGKRCPFYRRRQHGSRCGRYQRFRLC